MNILASYDWLKEYIDLGSMSVEDFAARVSLSGPGVERLYPQGLDLDRVVLGHVLEVQPHPNADKLKIVVVDVGARHAMPAKIVCGGSNVEVGQWVAVAQEGARVRWHGEGELIELKPTEIRGVKSEGMICAANEIGLFDAFPHADREILDLGAPFGWSAGKGGSRTAPTPGTPIADVLGLKSDTLMDIEITTNRPDAFSLVGLAREASAILNKKLTWVPSQLPRIGARHAVPAQIRVAEKSLCPRYLAAKIDGVKVGTSPWWLKKRLLSAGIRPINTVVDITNFVMLELGQPMHAFDASKLAGDTLTIRKAKAGETMAALDGKTYSLADGMLVIADAERPQAVAGIMGAETSSVTSDTKTIVFEAATFDPVSVRRTARALNLYSDAQLRFEKGLSVQAPPDALARAIELCLELCGGTVSGLEDIRASKYKPASFSIPFAKINELIGIPLKPKECTDTLKALGFTVSATSKALRATVPWWRDHDIEDGRDLVEEIARVYGYGNLPAVFPAGRTSLTPSNLLKLEETARTIAKGAGLTETFTYSFVSKALLERVGYDSSKLLRIQNPLSSDFEFMRTSLLPSLIDVVLQNQERARTQQLFEIQNVYYPTEAGWKALPDEKLELGAAFLGDDRAWREAKGFVEQLLSQLGVHDLVWKRLVDDRFWHPGRSMQAWKGEHLIATVGELHPSLAKKAGLEGRLGLVDMPIGEVFHVASGTHAYRAVPAFPQPKRDLAFIINREIEVQQMTRIMRAADPLVRDIEWFDTYTGQGMGDEKKSVAFHLTLGSDHRTLESAEVEAALERVKAAMAGAFDATVRA